ncbi:MAG: hypothetical protein J3Q66DRAFT_413629 [Benniella sp.]|nr:MAG: hypothetical protein J3Q66DRAFT_413629 [Benniella sp.]
MLIDSFITWATVAISLAQEASQWNVPDSKVRVLFQIGMDGYQEDSGLGSQVPSIYLEDTSSRPAGKYVNSGSDWIETVRGVLNSDARTGAIPGDLFWLCGYDWTYSGLRLNGTYDLRCGWLDGDNTPGNTPHAIHINTDIMGQGFVKDFAEKTPGELCNVGVRFSQGASLKKRAIKDTYGKRAFVTAEGGAIELCDSPTSRGKSMLSLKEGIFCDVLTKPKVPLCRSRKRDGCFKYERHVDENVIDDGTGI